VERAECECLRERATRVHVCAHVFACHPKGDCLCASLLTGNDRALRFLSVACNRLRDIEVQDEAAHFFAYTLIQQQGGYTRVKLEKPCLVCGYGGAAHNFPCNHNMVEKRIF